jgi:LPXTG-site transpeptidase (sortase) family protein
LPPAATAETIARLVIPKLGLDAPVVSAPMNEESWQVEHLGQAVGHLAGTALPGAASNMVLAGHVTLESGQPGPFIHLDQLAAGDAVYVDQADRRIEYVIDGSQIVDREAIEVTYPAETAVLTLITCSRWDETQARYLDRLVVQGHPVSP